MAKSQPVTEKPPKPDRVESDSDDDESDDEDYAPDGKKTKINNHKTHFQRLVCIS
jgi:hypothetical protein